MIKPNQEGYQADIPDEVLQEALESVDRRSAEPAEKAEEASQEPGPELGRLQADFEALQEELARTQSEAKEAHDKMLRIAADAENTRKRMHREREESLQYGQERLFRDLLPVLDNLQRSLESVPTDDPAFETFRKGVQIVHKQALGVLAQYQVLPFDSLNTPFDPAVHEAINQETCDCAPPGTVIGEVQKGYMIHDRLLRPAMVVVACATTSPSADESTPVDPSAQD